MGYVKNMQLPSRFYTTKHSKLYIPASQDSRGPAARGRVEALPDGVRVGAAQHPAGSLATGRAFRKAPRWGLEASMTYHTFD